MSSNTDLGSTQRKARKQHTCIWCGQHIAVGHTYVDHRVINDGRAESQKWHPECQEDFFRVAQEEGGGWCEFSAYENPRPVFTNCNVCGTKLRTHGEDAMGMCERCADEPRPAI